jgi:hypothetical protein
VILGSGRPRAFSLLTNKLVTQVSQIVCQLDLNLESLGSRFKSSARSFWGKICVLANRLIWWAIAVSPLHNGKQCSGGIRVETSIEAESDTGKIALRANVYPDVCPVCHHNIHPNFRFAYLMNSMLILEAVFQCPSSDCRHLFIATYRQLASHV